ncbi:flagellar motor switch protein FliN/FliY [Deferribacter desulfuricans SSM1]|uniref:Flagellar motor switch protein FliN n=1 Tax=Deferribacter desulfuricans (strain DSM 14783 / JCM 11476 / NBRC 101012 / SSM1) TaxID=639282 RepID=D3PBE2_DEFDS|nr:flagellar motor switch protein FliN [Deferribacter desulfuricans]BAI79915.1 flagellar motor switch protein FliN/FliY [Deferribacter desulfuricans SSM1]
MKNLFNLDDMPGYKEFVDLVKENFGSSLQTVINRDVEIEITEFFTGFISDVYENFDNPVCVKGVETESGNEFGLLFTIKDLTALVDYMMMGEGESKDELDDETKDGAKELITQIVSSLNVPLKEKYDKKFNFTVVDIFTEMSEEDEKEYAAYKFSIKADKIDSEFIFFIDSAFNSIIETSSEKTDDVPDFVPFEEGFEQNSSYDSGGNIDLLLDVEIPVSVKIGSTKMYLKDILELGPGKIIELEEYADEPVELLVNNKVIARGEVVVVDGYFGLRIQEIVSKAERIKKLKD